MTQIKSYTPPTQRIPEVSLTGKGKLILTQELQDQIDYLHKKVGSVEWCGILFYTKESGEIHNPENFVLKAQQIYPMNIGSEAYTEAEIEGLDIIDMYEKVPGAERMKQGLIHTHHRMATFFSGTDMSELHDNAPLHNYYLSLIVNFDGNYTAKIAYIATVSNKNTMIFNDSEDKERSVSSESERKVLVMMDLDIVKPVFQEVVPEYFQERYLQLEEEKKNKKSVYSGFQGHYPSSYNTKGSGNYYGSKDDEETGYNRQGELFGRNEKKEESIHPAVQAYQKAKKIQTKQKSTGKLVNESGKYISVDQQEFKELMIDWMNSGLDVDMEMDPSGKFSTLSQAISFFDGFYEKRSKEESDFFLDHMQKQAFIIFKDYSLKLVENRGKSLLESLTDSQMGSDLYNIISTMEQYAAIVEEYKSKIKSY